MRKNFTLLWSLLIALLVFTSPVVRAQCTPNPPSNQQGFYPNPAPDGCVGQYYDEVVQFVFPLDTTVSAPPFGTFTIPFDSFRVDSIVNVPNGIMIQLNNANNMYYPVSATVPARGCADIFGTPTVASPPMAQVDVYITAWATAPFLGVQTGQSTFSLGFQIYDSPSASFTFTTNTFNASFTDGSTGATSWAWDFGDGNTSTLQNPSHNYSNTGNYNVCLIASNGNCNDTTCNVVQIGCPAPTAAFTYSPSGLSVNFTDQTLANGTGWLWDFGDGNTSTSQNATHTYAAAGTYMVCMTITDNCGTDSVCQNVVVCEPLTPVATLTSSGLTLNYSGSSGTGTPIGYDWDFGDGTGTSTQQSGTYTYAAPGVYQVCLGVFDNCSLVAICPFVQVCETPAAAFSFTASGNGLDYAFSSSSTGQISSWSWDFGDGNTSTAGSQVQHSYASDGNYTVCLTITDSCNVSDTLCQNLTVTQLAPEIGIEALRIFPNPVNQTLYLQGVLKAGKAVEVSILDLVGREVKSLTLQQQGSFNQRVDLSGVQAGVYLVQFRSEQSRLTHKIVVE